MGLVSESFITIQTLIRAAKKFGLLRDICGLIFRAQAPNASDRRSSVDSPAVTEDGPEAGTRKGIK
jgi:hypothetical protein